MVVFDKNFWFTLSDVNNFFFGGGAGAGLLSLAVGGFSWVSSGCCCSCCCCCCSWRTSLSFSPSRPLSAAVSWLSGVPFSSSGIMRLGCILHEHSIHTYHPHSTHTPGLIPKRRGVAPSANQPTIVIVLSMIRPLLYLLLLPPPARWPAEPPSSPSAPRVQSVRPSDRSPSPRTGCRSHPLRPSRSRSG